MDKVWEIKDPDEYVRKRPRTGKDRTPVIREEKDPAKAYSLSMFYWGGGQLYNDQLGKGVAFLVGMAVVAASAVLFAIYHDDLLLFLRGRGISVSSAFLACEALVFCILLFWPSNAIDAYRRAARARKTRFRGVQSRVKPLVASLVAPGWGQFLNGQPVKGSLYTAFAVISLFSVLSTIATFLCWPELDASEARFLIEGVSAVSLALVPLMPLVWVLSAYDAYKVSIDDLKKEPLWERIKAAYYRGRTQGWVRGVMPGIRVTVVLILLLALFVVIARTWSPLRFYAGALASVRAALRTRGMTILPELIDQLLPLLGRQ